MPANLPPQYSKAEEEFRKATSPAERLDKLQEMFRLLPKHKGTEKLQSDLKQKISRLKDELEGGKPGAKKGGVSHRVPHEVQPHRLPPSRAGDVQGNGFAAGCGARPVR